MTCFVRQKVRRLFGHLGNPPEEGYLQLEHRLPSDRSSVPEEFSRNLVGAVGHQYKPFGLYRKTHCGE
jgi:hypothetical protein